MSNPNHNLAVLAAVLGNPSETLKRIDLLIDQLEELVRALPINAAEKAVYVHRLYELYSDVEMSVNQENT